MKQNQNWLQQSVAKEKQRWTIRKISVGVVSVLLGTTSFFFVGNTPQVRADSLNSSQQQVQVASDKESTSDTGSATENEKVAVDGNKATDDNLINKSTVTDTTSGSQGTTTTTTTSGTLDPKTNLSNTDKEVSLSSEVTKANEAGVKTNQDPDKTYGDVNSAGKDYADQIKNIDKATTDYQQAVQDFQKSLKDYNNRTIEYQKAKAEYEVALVKYKQQQTEYQQYKEKNAKDLANFQNDDKLTNVSQSSTTKNGIETTTTSATVMLPEELQRSIDAAKKLGIAINHEEPSQVDSTSDALKKYRDMTDAINKAINEYNAALDNYAAQIAVYTNKKSKWEEEKKAFEEYKKQTENSEGAGAVVAAQGLVFDRQKNATMTIDGADTYMTKEVSNKLNNQDVISRFDKRALDAMKDVNGKSTAYQSSNPNRNSENTWLVLKKGQPVTVTYHNLEGVTYNGNPVDHVVYKYELESSSDGTDEAMAQIMRDPTETIWVGSNSTNPDNHLRVKMTIGFYDSRGNKIDTSDNRAVLSLSSLNHYTTVPYISSNGKQEKIIMNHLEKVNIGNNEFVPIPGSSVTLNDNGWVYSVNSNQRISEGSKFDADDMYGYVNKQTGETFYTTDPDITNNKYILTHGGAQNWIKASKTVGWDDVPAANDGRWPVNKYYGAGAMKLTGDYIEFDVSGNTPDFNTSYWFNINSSIAVPQDPGSAPEQPERPTKIVEYNNLTVSKTESVKLPTAPKPEFDHQRPGDKPNSPDTPSVEWHLAKVVKVTNQTVPNNPNVPDKPSVPNIPGKPDKPSLPNKLGKPDKPNRPSVPNKSVKVMKTNHAVVSKQGTNKNQLPQTGEENNSQQKILGSILLVIVSLLGLTELGSRDRKKE